MKMRNKTLFTATAFALFALPTLGAPGLLTRSPLGRLLGPSLAYGQDEDPEVVAEAKKHYKLGQDAYAEAKYDVAIKELKKAYLLKRIPAILVNIASTYRKTHDYEMALYFYRKFLSEAAPDDKQRPSVETALVETEKERDAANQPKQLEPAKPAVEMAKPAAEPVKPAAEPAKPAAEPTAKPEAKSGAASPAPVAAAAPEPAAGAEAAEPARADKPATEWAHTPIDAVPPGQPVDVRVQMPVMKGVKVKAFYRKEGQANFDSVELKRRGNEKVARLPEAVSAGRTFQYYVEARDAAGTLVKNSGSQDSPNIVLVDPTARPQLAGADATAAEGPDDEELAKRIKTGPKRDIENEAVNFNLNEQQRAMNRLREQLRSGEKTAKKSALDPVGWAGAGLLIGGALAAGAGGGAMFGLAAGRSSAVSSDSMCETKVKVGGVAQCPHFGTNEDPTLNLALKPASADYERQGKQFDTIGTVLAAAGGALAVTGGALLIYDLVKRSRAEHAAAAPVKKRKVKKVIEVEEPAASLQVAPVIGLTGVGLVSEYRF
jgi:tetratricopeptide (TPR) repeat protein